MPPAVRPRRRPQTAGAATKAADTAATEEPPTEAERAIDLAIEKITKLRSVAAKLEQDVEMLNQKFKITGESQEGTQQPTLRCCSISPAGLPIRAAGSFRSATAKRSGIIELVLDQPFYRRLGDQADSRAARIRPTSDPEIGCKAMTQMGVAGPETLADRSAEEHPLRHQGRRPSSTARRSGNSTERGRAGKGWCSTRGRSIPSGSLPPYIPMDANLYLGMDDGWPYHLTLEGRR